MLFLNRLRISRPVVVALFTFAAVGRASGHSPEGSSVRAFPFALGSAPVVDGDLSDWQQVGPDHTITTAAFRELANEASVDEADFSVALKFGWCDELNRLYVAAEVHDDLHQIDRPSGSPWIFQDDAMEIFVDADHSGGQFADFSNDSEEDQLRMNGAEANHFVIAGPHPDGQFFINLSAAGWYALADGPFTAAAMRLDGSVAGPTDTSYEFMLVPFDRIDISADFLSVPHDLHSGETLGINVEFNDFDSHPDLFDAKWSLSGGFNSYRLSERFTDLVLDSPPGPTAVEGRSWGRIKASFDPFSDAAK